MPRAALSDHEVERFRDELCRVATLRFAEHGYGGVTLRALAAELGCSPMTPYRYFENKGHALRVFKQVWANPSYGTEAVPGIFSSFRRGAVEFFLMDGRYHKDVRNADQQEATIWGEDQLQWLFRGLLTSTAPVKVIANGTQFMDLGSTGEGHYPEARDEYQRILSFLSQNRIGGVIFLLGIPSSLSLGVWSGYTVAGKEFLSLMDYVGSNILLPVGGIAVSLFVGWVILPRALEEATGGGAHPFPLASLWTFICRYVAPIAVGWILVSGL